MNKTKIISIVILSVILLLMIYEIIITPNKNLRLIIKGISAAITLFLIIFRLRLKDGNLPLKVYESKFRDIIGEAFADEPANRKTLLRAIRLFSRERYKAALAKFETLETKAVTSKEHEVLIQSRALCYGKLNQPEDAANLYEELLKYRPDDPVVFINLGNMYQESGKFEKAVDVYQKAIEYDPKSATAYNNLAYVCLKLGLLESALSNAQKALELDETSYLSEKVAAMASELLGNRERSEGHMGRNAEN